MGVERKKQVRGHGSKINQSRAKRGVRNEVLVCAEISTHTMSVILEPSFSRYRLGFVAMRTTPKFQWLNTQRHTSPPPSLRRAYYGHPGIQIVSVITMAEGWEWQIVCWLLKVTP